MINHNVALNFNNDLREAAAQIETKMLIVVGEDDRVVTPQPALKFAAMTGATVLKLDEDCGHGDPWCAADAFAVAVSNFISNDNELAQSEVVATATEANAQPLPDDLGTSKFGDDQKSNSIEYSGTITSCEKGAYGNWYFTFDNGQIWKEVVDRKLRFKDCNFSATITEDFFGHKMKVDAYKKPIRIKRYR
jgi:hypothetical protein